MDVLVNFNDLLSNLSYLNQIKAPSYISNEPFVPTGEYLAWQACHARQHVKGWPWCVWIIDAPHGFTDDGVPRWPANDCFLAAGVLDGEDAVVAARCVELVRARLKQAKYMEVMFLRGAQDDTWALLVMALSPQKLLSTRFKWHGKLEALFETAWADAKSRRAEDDAKAVQDVAPLT